MADTTGLSPSLERFLDAQRPTYPAALAELRAGRKTGHWIWFIFPQIAGLGRSETSRFYAITSLEEARAYVAHPVLGARLRQCATALLAIENRSATATDILGATDALKLRSSMTLFHRAASGDPLFREVLDRFFNGIADPATDERLR